MEMLDGDIAAVYAERTGRETEELLAIMDVETWLTAEEAVSQGFVDEVYEVKKAKPKAESKAEIMATLAPAFQRGLVASLNRRIKLRRPQK